MATSDYASHWIRVWWFGCCVLFVGCWLLVVFGWLFLVGCFWLVVFGWLFLVGRFWLFLVVFGWLVGGCCLLLVVFVVVVVVVVGWLFCWLFCLFCLLLFWTRTEEGDVNGHTTLSLTGAESPGSKTLGDSGTSRPSMTHSCECSRAPPGRQRTS